MAEDADFLEEVEPAVVEEPSETDKLVDQWWADSFPGSVLGFHTDAWNCVFEAVADLKQRLRATVTH